LSQVERAEERIRALGFRDFRARHHGSVVRLEFSPVELEVAFERAGSLAQAMLDVGFEQVLLDVEGYRRGSLNVGPLVPLRASS
jgi:uncharacterized protein